MINLKNISSEELDRIRQDYKNYSGLIFNDDSITNPLAGIPKDLEEKPHLYYTWLLSNPDYIHFFCSEFLNVHLLPFQCVIIKELWERKFPMLVATRGGSKAVSINEQVRVKDGWKEIKDLKIGEYVYGSDGNLCKITNKTEVLKDLNFYKITFRDGRTVECCEDHLWKVWDKYKNQNSKDVYSTIDTKTLFNSYSIKRIGDKSNGTEFRYAIPIAKNILCDTKKNFKIHPYIVGALLGDGCLRHHNVSITSKDIEIINRINDLLPDGYIAKKVESSKYQYSIRRLNNKVKSFKKLCEEINIFGNKSENKFIPEEYKYSSEEDKLELLKGLMDTDGCSSKGHITYSTVSNLLAQDFCDLVRSLGISCKKSIRKVYFNGQRYKDSNLISLYTDVNVFYLDRKTNINKDWKRSKQATSKFEKTFIVNIEYIGKKDGMCISVDSPDRTYLIKDYIVTHNSFCLAVYVMLRALLLPGRKIVVAGASFRQSKLIYEYCCQIWNNSPLLRDSIISYSQKQGPFGGNDSVFLYLGDSKVTFIPVGSGETIRGLRANDVITDEFKSLSQEIFENVIAGFASVESSPQEKVASRLESDFNKLAGIEDVTKKDNLNISNQIVISGTAYYYFNHFAEYWNKWHKIVSSKGDPKKLEEIFPEGLEDGFDWRDYSIIRLPYDVLPKSYMDGGNIARSKATLNNSLFSMEFLTIFSKDSDGFFKATLIESCVASEHNEIEKKSGLVNFFPRLSGDHDKRYYMGVDTASQVDNFAIVIIEAHRDHRRIVYCWTTNTKEFKEGRKTGTIAETDFFRYCSGKIRSLMSKFQIERIAIDSQGGGRTIYETLHDKVSLKPGEQMIWEAIEPGKLKETDSEEGLHIIEMVNFRKQEYTLNANHGLKKDFEDKICLFPEYNPAILASYSNLEGKFAQEMEDCIENIEELKRELTTIVVTSTATGNERFDTPENKASGVSETSRNKKDRYSALIMANSAARKDYHDENDYSARSIEQIANNSLERKDAAYIGPAWITEKLNNLY